jgi:hypothetical protein
VKERTTEHLRWRPPSERPPRRPYRDSAILYGVLAAVIVLVAWATGGGPARAVAIATGFFVAATAWSTWQWRARLRRSAQAPEPNGRGVRPDEDSPL